MTEQKFEKVWYRPNELKWYDLSLRAYKDTGTLFVRENSIEFQGQKYSVMLAKVQRITFGKQGRDFVNNWVKIEYNDSALSVAFFADGNQLGWSGVSGGTERILHAVQHFVK